MSLRDRLGAEKAALEAKKLEEQQKEQEITLIPVKARIAELEKNKKSLEELRSQVGTDLQGFLDSAKTFKGTSREIDTLRKEFADVLVEKDIHSKGDFVEGEEFQDEKEVQAYKQAKDQTAGSASKMRETLAKVREAVPDLQPKPRDQKSPRPTKTSPDSWQAKVTSAIDSRIREIELQLQEAKLQTPEGQAERAEEFRKKVETHFQRSVFLDGRGGIQTFVPREYFAERKKYGDSTVKEVVLAEAKKKIGQELEQQRPELDQNLVVDVKMLSEYRERIPAIEQKMAEVRRLRQDAERKLRHWIDTNEKFRNDLAGFGLGSGDLLEQRYITFAEEMYAGSESFEKLEALVRKARNFDIVPDESSYGYGNRKQAIQIPDINQLDVQLDNFATFYASLTKRIEEKNLPLGYNNVHELAPSSRDRIHSVYIHETSARIGSFNSLSSQARALESALEERKKKMFEVADARLAADWSGLELSGFISQHDNINGLHRDLKLERKQFAKVAEQLAEIRPQIQPYLDLKVEVIEDQPTWSGSAQNIIRSVDYTERRGQISDEYNKLTKGDGTSNDGFKQKSLQQIKNDLSLKERELSKAWIKGKLQAEVQKLQETAEQRAERIRQLDVAAREAAAKLDYPLDQLRRILGPIRLGESIKERKMTVGELLDHVEKMARGREVTAEQNHALKELERLLKENDSARQRYETAVRAANS